jgi:serine/threonine-protein kinase
MAASDDEISARATMRLGTVLRGKYRLDRLIGFGGMATVFQATHLGNAGRVAVKILHRAFAEDPVHRARFLREGYYANSVDHPGVVRILDEDTAEDGAVFLVMELLDGENIDDRWERQKRHLNVTEVVWLLEMLLDVLAAAHEKGIVHRDVKPDNLFLTSDGRLKVLDFGVARMRDAPFRTPSGALLGTAAYMAPEQALGRRSEVDAISDMWSVGATAFLLISGRSVHIADTPEELLVLAATRAAPPLATVAPHVPPAISDVIDRALAFHKADRWPSARAMLEALRRARGEGAGQKAEAPLGKTEGVSERIRIRDMPTLPSKLASFRAQPSMAAQTAGRRIAKAAVGAGVIVCVALAAVLALTNRARSAASQKATIRATRTDETPEPRPPTATPTASLNPIVTTTTSALPTALGSSERTGAPRRAIPDRPPARPAVAPKRDPLAP